MLLKFLILGCKAFIFILVCCYDVSSMHVETSKLIGCQLAKYIKE